METSGTSSGLKLTLSAILPAFNEAATLGSVVSELSQVLSAAGVDFEIIIVNDGSTDATPALAEALTKAEPRLRVIHHPRNLGYGAALSSGFAAASYDWIFFTDADGQFDLQELPRFLQLIPLSLFIAGWRRRRADPLHRRLYGRLFSALVRTLFHVKVHDVNCAFKLFRKDLLPPHGLRSRGALINAEILAHARLLGVDPLEVAVTHRPREKGRPTGGNPAVILRAAGEIFQLWRHLRREQKTARHFRG